MDEDRDYKRLLKAIAANIRRMRLKRELTQEDMMDFGYNYRFFQKLESGSYSPNLRTIHRLSKTFKVDIDEFFKGSS